MKSGVSQLGARKDHINISVLESGHKVQDRGRFQKHVCMWSPHSWPLTHPGLLRDVSFVSLGVAQLQPREGLPGLRVPSSKHKQRASATFQDPKSCWVHVGLLPILHVSITDRDPSNIRTPTGNITCLLQGVPCPCFTGPCLMWTVARQ